MKNIRIKILALSIASLFIIAGCGRAESSTVIAPNAPGTLALTSGPGLLITLSWLDNSTNEEGFEIERGTNGVNFITIGTASSNNTGYQDNGLAQGNAYYYRVRAFNDAGFSAYSNIAKTLIAWVKTYGGTWYDLPFSIRQTEDGGYIVAGATNSFGAGSDDAWVLKLNSDGTVAWQKTYGGPAADSANSIRQTTDGGYIVAGYATQFGAGSEDAWVLKLNSDGTVAWQKTYGGASDDVASSIQQTADSGYIVAGFTKSFGAGNYSATHTHAGNDNSWVLKLNSDGTVVWQKTYGGTGDDWASSIRQTADGGYIVAGETDSFGAGNYDAWVLKLKSDGTVAWQKTYGGTSGDWASSIRQTADDGYIVAGETDSFGAGSGDAWVLKLKSDGTVAWQKAYGGTGWDTASSIRQTADGGYIVAGLTDSFGAGRYNAYSYDVWVLRLPSDGSVSFKPSSGASVTVTSVTSADSSATLNNTTASVVNTTITPTVSTATVSSTNANITEQAP